MDRDRASYFRYWGKATKEDQSKNHHLLVYHSLDVAAVGDVLLSKHETLRQRLAALAGFSDEMVFKQWIVFFLALHDLGKFAESFQNLKPDLLTALQHGTSERQYGIGHDSLGYMLWRAEIKTWFPHTRGDEPEAHLSRKRLKQCSPRPSLLLSSKRISVTL